MKYAFKTEYPNTYTSVNIIPLEGIKKLDFVLCKQPTERLSSFYTRQTEKPDIVINGGLFNMSNGINVMSFVDEGVEQNYQNGFEGFGTKTSNPSSLVLGYDKDGGWKDFMTGYPVLVKDGVATSSATWGNATQLNYTTSRTAIGVNDTSLFIITVDKPGMKFDALAKLFVSYGAKHAINLDGGGSVRKLINGVVANNPSEDRAVDNVFCVYLKNVEQEAFIPGVYCINVNTTLNIRSAPIVGSIVGTFKANDEVIVHSVENGWGTILYNNSVAYISMSYAERLYDVAPPEADDGIDIGPFSSLDDVLAAFKDNGAISEEDVSYWNCACKVVNKLEDFIMAVGNAVSRFRT